MNFNNGDFDSETNISLESKNEITWWVVNLKSVNGKLIRPNSIDCWIETDASLEGWGSKFNENLTGGRWNDEERSPHINYLELLSIFWSLKSFFSQQKSLHIGVRSDSTTAVVYINDMGGMSFVLLDKLSAEIWSWCSQRNIFITAQFLPGIHNFDADHMSRNFTDSTEWKLKKEIFDRICNHFFVPDIDLFTSHLNCQIPSFVSWSFDPQASFVDAFTIPWASFSPYIFPPFSLLGKIIMKLINDMVERAILVVPFWPAQSWFSSLISILISLPVRLPRHTDLVTLPHSGQYHPLRKRLNLIVCLVSGNPSLVEDFHRNLQTSSSLLGDRLQLNNTNILGENMYFGAIKGAQIPFDRMKRM